MVSGFFIAVVIVAANAPAAEEAGPRPPVQGFPVPDPQEMFNRFFGKPTEAEKRQLAEIPVSLKEERQVGNGVVEAFLSHLRRQGIRVVTRGRDVEYLRELVETLRPRMQNGERYRTIKVYVAKSPECDARSFPGGTLVFFEGLLDFAESEAALVAIVGHELSHLDRGHQLERVRRMKLAKRTFSGGRRQFSPEQFFATGTAVLRAWTRPFQPEDEMEADRDGATWAYRTGYDPREMARLFANLERRQAGQRIPLPDFLRSHPLPLDRRRAIMEIYRDLEQTEPSEDLYVGRENLRRRVARATREFPE